MSGYVDIQKQTDGSLKVSNQGVYQISIGNENLEFVRLTMNDPVLTGRQILEAANLFPTEDYMLLMRQASGTLEEINLSETIDVYQRGVEQFFTFKSDRVFYFELNGKRLPWGSKSISESILRYVGEIPPNQSLWQAVRDTADQLINSGDSVDLSKKGLERIYSRAKEWKLNVHGVIITSDNPTIVASEAMRLAGFDPTEDWNLILKVKDQPKKSIAVSDVIDLSAPGIEKLRLMRKEIVNGEKPLGQRIDFALLEKDIAYLNASGLQWETLLDGQRRWLIIRNYLLPKGYNHDKTDIAIDIPLVYPNAALDMFYCNPSLCLKSGTAIAQTESQQAIAGKSFQRWSRHLAPSTRWNPATDSIITQMTVVEESLLREVGE
jgi:hypothetical protein